MTTFPERPVEHFVDLYKALAAERGAFEGYHDLRYAAVTVLASPGSAEEVASGIRDLAEEFTQATSWSHEMRPLHFMVSAILFQTGDSVLLLLEEVERVRAMFRERKLRRGGVYETIAILCMRLWKRQAPIELEDVERFQELYEAMKDHHWWLTGPEDFPACGSLVGEPGEAKDIARDIEEIYQAIHDEGFSQGDPLQTAANHLFLARRPPREIAERFRDLAAGFRGAGVKIYQSDYDELAILTFLGQDTEEIVSTVLEHREPIKLLKPQVDPNVTFSLAASTAFVELVGRDGMPEAVTEGKTLLDAKSLMDQLTLIHQQEAAMVAVLVACT